MKAEAQVYEKINTVICRDAVEASEQVAREIIDLIRKRSEESKPVVLGLATGSTPLLLYKRLIQAHRDEGLSFKNVITFNLDEYYGLEREHPESYWKFMHDQLFDHIDIPAENINLPDGRVPRDEVFAYCQNYEKQIEEAGGLDIQILGIGRTGHIGFNEPGSSEDSLTRMVTLDHLTRKDAARDFQGENAVPRNAITMGIGTILKAEKIYLMAWGQAKAEIISKAVEAEPTGVLPASFLQLHKNATFYIDRAAASELTRIKRPWLVGPCDWERVLIRKAVIWLARERDKPVLKLRDADYSEFGLSELLTDYGPAYDLNIAIFNDLQRSITGWPGGKPDADDTYRPERALPKQKRSLVLSPEPLIAEMGMGATIRRLVSQGHEVTLAHLCSGNLAVSDRDALYAAEFASSVIAEEGDSNGGTGSRIPVLKELREKSPYEDASPTVRAFKGLLRKNEATTTGMALKLESKQIRHLDLPFYEKGRYRRFKPEEDDVAILVELLREIQPHQIYMTGHQSDPSSLDAVSFGLFKQAVDEVKADDWWQDCRVWLYSPSDSLMPCHETEMSVPVSPDELQEKVMAIYNYHTQRSQVPGIENQEAWDVARSLGRKAAEEIDALGLAEYEALERFQHWKEQA
ncbi:glucosamine-6-phosphate deaminase [Coraliomargarita sinensis]|uniref:Glucosamine-6-phosphate deaminase n=1 Tax=Coraliomargarita sinensis TaxID=2174842 RepID=A0A317ZF37_9BACT|nr:glucosamine-6-phosphate deaminase [Coraliomargarita sinensis]PXA04164.1 glucosamine-6-phosphate deaminase [Coraliomargarita sinensis]